MSTEPKWTQGEWLEDGPHEDGSWDVFTDAGDAESRHVASVAGNRHDAYLITAAPALYESVQNLMGLFDNAVYRRKLAKDNLYTEAIQTARKALAGARGETE